MSITKNDLKNVLKKYHSNVKTLLNSKVDKVSGKGLSTNDYTTAEKNKLAGIATGANNYSHPTTSGNKHIPAGGSSGQILRWSSDGTAVWGSDTNTDTKVTNTLATTTKAYITGTTSATTNTGTQVFDTGVYLDTTAGMLTAKTFKGALSGNASTATKLQTARTISLTGSVTGSGSFDGSGNLSITTTTNHTHDDRYYTESEVNSKLSTTLSSAKSYTDSQISALNVDMTETEITTLISEILA